VGDRWARTEELSIIIERCVGGREFADLQPF